LEDICNTAQKIFFGRLLNRRQHRPAFICMTSQKIGRFPMLVAFVLILGAVLIGDVLTATLGVPIPGSVLGLLAAAALFASRGGGPTPSMSRIFDAIIPYAPMLFVPAGAGIVANWGLVTTSWFPIMAAATIGTGSALLVTGLSASYLLRRLDGLRVVP
jgi:holin-like protein